MHFVLPTDWGQSELKELFLLNGSLVFPSLCCQMLAHRDRLFVLICFHLALFLCVLYFFNAIGCVAYTAISLSCWLGFQFPHISIQSSICGMSWTSKSDPWRLHLQEQQLTGIKGSAANIFVPDTTGHLQLSSRVHALMGQSCFGSNRGDQPSVRQVVLILRLIGV